MSSQKKEFSFLEDFILEVLKQNGLANLSEANQRAYLPQLVAEAEFDLGIVLLPKLAEDDAKKFAALGSNLNTTPGEWKKFWASAVPNFDAEVKKVLNKFAEKVSVILNK